METLRCGNAPGKTIQNVLAGTQNLTELARSVMYYYGAKRFDGWEAWREPVEEALDLLAAEDDARGGAA